MGRQQATLENLKSIAAVALVGLGLAILLGKLGGPTAQVDSILSCVARETIGLLSYIVPRPGGLCRAMSLITKGFLRAIFRCWYPAGRCCKSWLERPSCGHLRR